MRPVEKKNVGDVVSYINNQTGVLVNHTIKDTYNPYSDAKDPLVANLGGYCSYCEARLDVERTLEIEHVQPKSLVKYRHLEFAWRNFLLACPICNASPNKGDNDVVLADVHLPHRDNTFISFVYNPDGSVEVNPTLEGIERKRAQKLYELLGFNRYPGVLKPTATDKRWLKRAQTWNMASSHKEEFLKREITAKHIVDLALEKGYWSIWYTVFSEVSEVLELLISEFKGTASCFDSDDGFKPMIR